MGNKYLGKLKKTAERMVIRDGQTISSVLINSPYRAIVSMLLLPYAGLYCKEAEEFYGKKVVSPEIDTQIVDLRNSIKIFCGKYNALEREFLLSDEEQDDYFKSLLRFDFVRQMNIHYNLGIYFDNDGHVIGNTQLINFHLKPVTMGDSDANMNAYKLGNAVGVSVKRILMFSNTKVNTWTTKGNQNFCVGYIDYNSNNDNSPFAYDGQKGLNLLMLHILGLLGTCKYLLRTFLNDNNQWLYRCEYVISHNIWAGLRIIKAHYEQDKSLDIDLDFLAKLVEHGRHLFPSSYRNCMMHYNLVHEGEPCIKEEYYRPDIPLFGLVESCFAGKTAAEYYSDLRSYIDEVEDYLNTWFTFDYAKIRWDL